MRYLFSNSKDSSSGSSSENSSNIRPLSIEGPRSNNEGQTRQATQIMPNQSRQPSNLSGLLRFAMDATQTEDAPHASHVQPLDEEVQSFFLILPISETHKKSHNSFFHCAITLGDVLYHKAEFHIKKK